MYISLLQQSSLFTGEYSQMLCHSRHTHCMFDGFPHSVFSPLSWDLGVGRKRSTGQQEGQNNSQAYQIGCGQWWRAQPGKHRVHSDPPTLQSHCVSAGEVIIPSLLTTYCKLMPSLTADQCQSALHLGYCVIPEQVIHFYSKQWLLTAQ